MAFDPEMAETMRVDLEVEPGLSEKKMFGGLCFFLAGNMICGVGGQGALYRPGKAAEPDALALDGVSAMVMGGRKMGGFVRLSHDGFQDDGLRNTLTHMSLTHAASLPAKG